MENYIVWVGGIEVVDYPITKSNAEEIAESWRDDGYDDVQITEVIK